ncbi:hypothetical protein [Paenochrobactrum glaciei]|uniref:Internal virion protein B n=1 Tax=Paenochrobactrum glaciei TaxID=486407 RepID=A0ABN1GMY7_9HYPH
MTLIGAGVSVAGQIAGAQAQSASYKQQAAYADRQARMASEKGEYDAILQGRSNDRQIASMRGQYLSSGIALSGSSLDVLQESATEASLDEQAIRYGAQVQSDNYRFQAGLARSNAKSAVTGGYMGALATGVNAFTGISQHNQQRTMISNPYTQYQRARSGSIQGLF